MPAVFLVKAAEAAVFFCIVVADGGGTVGGAVVNKKRFKIGEGLGKDAVQTVDEIRLCVIYGYDDR